MNTTKKSVLLPMAQQASPLWSKTIQMFVFVILLTVYVHSSQGQGYGDTADLFRDKLGNNSNYNTDIRPVFDQSKTINVSVDFSLIAIAQMDDINQKFVVNGFLALSWVDEVVAWNMADYNWVAFIHPIPQLIWRPRMVLLNTLEGRDLLKDDYSPVLVLYNGQTSWFPGSLFPTSCKLNLKKFPFDRQMCEITMFSMGLASSELTFIPVTGKVILDNYSESGSWKIESTSVVSGDDLGLGYFRISFTLTRRSGFFIMNIVMPVVMLSLLNIMVFLIPVESGEKISYGITVLLALAVFMSIVSGMLPRSSDVVPLVTVYLVVLLVISVCTVVVAIFIVWLHFREEKETKRHKATKSFQGIFKKVRIMNRATVPVKEMPLPVVGESSTDEPVEKGTGSSLLDALKRMRHPDKGGSIPNPLPLDDPEQKHYVNKYKMIGRHIDTISFVLFMFIWVSVTIGFVVEISS